MAESVVALSALGTALLAALRGLAQESAANERFPHTVIHRAAVLACCASEAPGYLTGVELHASAWARRAVRNSSTDSILGCCPRRVSMSAW